ncbi:MAG: MFS transporter [Bradyrhizobiaceae bacterium]|nr:MAG: MFS transporter [Bradyrhizobiaceae bacterium]
MSVAQTLDSSPAGAAAQPELSRIVWASVFGTIIEWYDFLIYGTAAALVFNKLFFPTLDPLAGTLAAFATYAVGFGARPLGGIIFGHYGDKIGRKAMLMMTLTIMGVGTFLIGCLPTYAQIGIWAPILLVVLRLLQGIGVGGEWSGAVLMVIEHAPADKRGLYGSLVQIGFPAGIAASTGTFLLLAMLPEADFLSWGWRLPFLFSAVLIAVGIFIRLRLAETPVFQKLQEEEQVARMPLMTLIKENPKELLISIGLKVSEVAWVYMMTVFTIVYATTKLGLPKILILNAILAAALLEFITMPLFGWMSDKVGRRNMFIAGCIISAICAFAVFPLMDTKNPTIIIVSIAVIVSLTHAMMFGPEAAYLPELFGTKTRYTGSSIGCQVAAAISGGLIPVIATGLLAWTGGTLAISWYLVLLAAISLISALASVETKTLDLSRA